MTLKPSNVCQWRSFWRPKKGALVVLRIQDYKSVCTPVTICAILVDPKRFLSILTPLTLKSRSNPRQLLHPCQMHPQCKFGDRRSVARRDNADISIFYDAINQYRRSGWPSFGSSRTVHQYVPVYKISGFCVYRLRLWQHLMSQTDRQTYRLIDPQTDGFCTEHMNSSASRAKKTLKRVLRKKLKNVNNVE